MLYSRPAIVKDVAKRRKRYTTGGYSMCSSTEPRGLWWPWV